MLWPVRFIIMLSLAVAVSLVGCGSYSANTIVLQGAGATFPAPIYKRWFLEYHIKQPDVRVSYQPIGSGAGARQFLSGLIDFGASDAALSDAEIAQAPNGALLVPLTAGSISVAYNLPDITSPLRMSRDVLAKIFLGEITYWNDPLLQADNVGVALPDLPIRVVRRADSSGTTLAFTNHLSAISPTWKDEVGVSKSVDKWKVGIGGRGNAGVAATIKRTPGTVGYLESGYAKFSELPSAILQNKAGQFVSPTPEAGQAALAGSPLPANLRLFLPDPEGAYSYPIVTYSWVIARKQYADAREAQTLKDVLTYCLTEGQPLAVNLGYIPLPKSVSEQVLRAVQEIRP